MRTGAGRPPGSLALLGALALCGCYTYQPVERPSPGTPVRVHVPVRSAVEGSSRAPETVTMEGNVVSFDDTLRLATQTEQRAGSRSFVAVDTIRVGAASLAGVEERVFSRGRTAMFTAALVGGVALATWGISTLAGGEDGEKPGNGPTTGSPVIIFGHQGFRVFGIPVPFP